MSFPEAALDFYEGLVADNSKAYWTDHKSVYETAVRAPLLELLTSLEPEFGTAKVFRPYRDVRFSKDKTPYKTHAAAVVERPGGSALYLQLSADGLYLGGGVWHTATDQVQRLRAAVADERTGPALVAVLDGLSGWEVLGERYKRLPKPFTPDHPRADLLHHKALAVGRSHEPGEWLHGPACRERVVQGWRAVLPLDEWLDRHVGRSREG